jgi:hypothetical protein
VYLKARERKKRGEREEEEKKALTSRYESLSEVIGKVKLE